MAMLFFFFSQAMAYPMTVLGHPMTVCRSSSRLAADGTASAHSDVIHIDTPGNVRQWGHLPSILWAPASCKDLRFQLTIGPAIRSRHAAGQQAAAATSSNAAVRVNPLL